MTTLAIPGHGHEAADPEPKLRSTVVAGLVVIVAFVGAFAGWSLFAQLDSAVIAQGRIVSDSQRKIVQHLEGGILRELLVREGDVVRAGQAVALLDTTQSDSQLGQLVGQINAVQARIARLRAEQEGERKLVLPEDLRGKAQSEPALAETLLAQQRLFEARWRAHDSAIAVVRKRIDQIHEEMTAAQAQLTAVTLRISSLEDELRGARQLLSQGFERRTRVLDLERSLADLRGKLGEYRGFIARGEQMVAGANLEIGNQTDMRLSDIARELQEARVLEADLTDRIRAARDVRQRREIVSPQDGTVTDIRLVTPGGVIGPGQPVMDIVPLDDELIVEARVMPQDSDSVRAGLPTQIRLTAYKRAIAPLVDGELTYISADMLQDVRTGDRYFLARARLSRDSLAQWRNVKLNPGMPAEILILTGERRAIEYLVQPLFERFHRAMREE
ncbi:MAG: HlyD family type I secretion periplasmic adaptor subunit [Alphaproteobacteria bacterium]|nr:HlyD family type I secretion periplasmic adaptor subunit [Alphaproteobacteria bacterium]